jgi:nucleotide-binding universal stress UspA family protein
MRPKILCCIDNGEASERALTAAIQLAKRLQGSLALICINPLMPGRGAPMTVWPEPFVTEILRAAACKARWAGLSKVDEVRYRALNVAHAIIAHADENESDYIVLGTRDRSSVARVLGGSVSREVIASANCPVLAVRRLRELRWDHPRNGLRRRSDVTDLAPARTASA